MPTCKPLRRLWAGLFLVLTAVAVPAAEVRNIGVVQEGSRLVVRYDLEDEKPVEVSAVVAVDGHLYADSSLRLEGDVGRQVAPGKGRRFTWDILKDYPQGITGDVLVNISAQPKPILESDIVALGEVQTEVFRRIEAEGIDTAEANRRIGFSDHGRWLAARVDDTVRNAYVHEVDRGHLEKSRYYCARFATTAVGKDQLASVWPARRDTVPVIADADEEKYLSCLLGSLDPHSSFLTPEAYRELMVSTKGVFGGLGLEVGLTKGVLTVVSPIEDTPAYRAGVKAGDRILEIDGVATRDQTLTDAVKRLRGPKGSRVTLTIGRDEAAAPISLTIVRDVILVRSVRSRLLADGYGYVRISQFQERTAEDFGRALDSLRLAAGGSLKGLVLDLRNDPGGLLNSAVQVASRFIDKGLVVYTQGRESSANSQYPALATTKEASYPIVVLINRGSASAAEIVAGALQDHQRAIVVGSRSFGKGSVQSVIPIGDAAVRLTTAWYYTPGGRSIQQIGIEPDVVLDQDPASDDGAIAFGQRLLREAATTPGIAARKDLIERLKVEEFLSLYRNGVRASVAVAPAMSPAVPRLSTAAMADHRVALVIGNGAYANSPLKNPVNDARAVSAKLRGLGFEVITRENVAQKEMTRAITLFGEKLVRPGTVGLFFYAGHGMQVRGKNYLIPVDAQITSEASVRSEAVDVDSLLEQLATSTLGIVILDACRNNPFERRFRGGSGGLAQIDAPKGTLIAYATAPGKVASDGDGRNGLYTQEFLRVLDEPGLKVEDVFKRVRRQVADATADQQVPWESSSLTGDFYFARKVMAAPEAELLFWQSIRDSRDSEDFAAYLRQYPKGQFADIARNRLRRLDAR